MELLPWEVKGKRKFCSMKCWYKWRVGTHHSAEEIQKMSEARKEWLLKNPGYIESCKGANNPNWKGGVAMHSGYKLILMPGHPNADHRGYVREHILVATKALGRPSKKGELVHHINGNKSDNRNCNLLICDNSYHRWLEGKMARLYKQEHFGGV